MYVCIMVYITRTYDANWRKLRACRDVTGRDVEAEGNGRLLRFRISQI